jgi:hypothetical protein
MNATGFRAGCREQAGLAIHVLGSWLGRYAPKGTGRVMVRGGCLLLFPFVTLLFWFLQAILWAIVAAPILAYALLMAIIGGGFRRGVSRGVPQAAAPEWHAPAPQVPWDADGNYVHPNPPAPPPLTVYTFHAPDSPNP